VALYILNHKRQDLADIEARYGFKVYLIGDDLLVPPAHRMEKVRSEVPIEIPKQIIPDPSTVEEIEEDEIEEIEEEAVEAIAESKPPVAAVTAGEIAGGEAVPGEATGEEGDGTRRRRRRRRRRGRREETGTVVAADSAVENATVIGEPGETVPLANVEPLPADSIEDSEEGGEGEVDPSIAVADGDPAPRRRRRGKRGGRRRHRRADGQEVDAEGNLLAAESVPSTAEIPSSETTAAIETTIAGSALHATSAASDVTPVEAPAKPKRSRKKAAPVSAAGIVETAPAVTPDAEAAPPKPKRIRAPRQKAAGVPVIPESTAKAPNGHDTIPAAPVPDAPVPVVVTPQVTVAPSPAAYVPADTQTVQEDAKPTGPAAAPRKGWWNRFL
jgi:ribonuclease E